MNTKQWLAATTLALMLSLGTGTWNGTAAAEASSPSSEMNDQEKRQSDDFLNALGVSSDEELYDAIYQGKSLADIAQEHHTEVDQVINVQILELKKQLDQRLIEGSIGYEKYLLQLMELPEIITESVYAQPDISN